MVIDVLRSFTTAAVSLDRGAVSVYPVENPAAARRAGSKLETAVSIGALAGGAPVPGVRGLHRIRWARRLYAASLVCATATADAIRQAGAEEVCFVITGEWDDRDGDEDIACADYMEVEALIRVESPPPEFFAQRVRQSACRCKTKPLNS